MSSGLAHFVSELKVGERHDGTTYAMYRALRAGASDEDVAEIREAALSVGLTEREVQAITATARNWTAAGETA